MVRDLFRLLSLLTSAAWALVKVAFRCGFAAGAIVGRFGARRRERKSRPRR